MNKIHIAVLAAVLVGLAMVVTCRPRHRVNAIDDPHFTADGHLVADSTVAPALVPAMPSAIRLFVEVSGSMNGFFRANRATQFKTDVWQIVSYFDAAIPHVGILTNDGAVGAQVGTADFQTLMNTGAFVSAASTRVPVMLQSVIDNIDAEAGEVAVLVSDMKYSPVGVAAAAARMAQYSTDISHILGKAELAVSLVCATSDYLGHQGNTLAASSPYYYLILGGSSQVAYMRNAISTLLEERCVDNIDTGMDYGQVAYEFAGQPTNCFRMAPDEPTFCGVKACNGDTAKIKLAIDLSGYRWLTASEEALREALSVKSLWGGCKVEVGDIAVKATNITDRQLRREAVATIELLVTDMYTKADVLEWQLTLPDSDVSLFAPFMGADTEDDLLRTYSLEGFIKGMFYGGVLNTQLPCNYILLSKNS